MCHTAMDGQMTTTDTDEPVVDKRLREFFSKEEHIFQVSRKVVNSFMKHNANENGNGNVLIIDDEEEPQPQALLDKCDISNRSKDNCETDSNMDMFQPIYQPIKASDSEAGPNANATNEGTVQKRRGQSFKLQVAYQGHAFCGWQIQPNNDIPSIQQTLIDCLDPLLNSDPNKPIDIRVCGRTDAGVSALGQYCRVRTLRSEEEVGPAGIQKAINDQVHLNSLDKSSDSDGSTSIVHEHASIPLVWCTSVERVTDKFHPTFDAKCRAYLYLIDADPLLAAAKEFNKDVRIEDIVSLMDSMLQEIQGEELDFFALSYGKVKTENTLCTLSRARAYVLQTADGQRAVGIELVGNRFLRRMVRILVATTIREALIMLDQDLFDTATARARLLAIVNTNNRTESAKAAPSNGLIFVGARFH